jgi:PAS domain-containing protein
MGKMAKQRVARILVVDGEPGLVDDYRLALCGQPERGGGKDPADPDFDFFGSALCHDGLPDIELAVCRETAEALEAVERAVGRQRPFALAFVDPCGAAGLEAVAGMRALDPELYIVLVTTAADIQALDASARVSPADRLYYVQKPFHAVEIRQLALALGEKWRRDRETSEVPMRTADARPADAPAMSPAGVLVFDADDRLLSADSTIARMFPELAAVFVPGARYEEIQLQMARQLLPEDTLYRVQSWLRDRLDWHAAGGGLHEQRLRGSRWILMAEARVEGQGTTCHFYDVTELKRRTVRRAAEAHQTQMSQAFAGLCDRLCPDPEATGIGRSDGKVVSFPGGARQAPPAAGRLAGSNGCEFNGLLGKLQAVAQRQRLLPEQLDLDAAVPDLAQAGDYAVPAAIRLEVVASAGAWPVLVDRAGLAAALGELVRNACEAMPEGGHLVLEVGNARLERYGPGRADHVRLSIRDTGPGMSAEIAERALNPFFTTKGEATHPGLGLNTVHGFVSQSGGWMEIETAHGQGTRVDLYFPRATVSQGVLEALNGPARGRPNGGSAR